MKPNFPILDAAKVPEALKAIAAPIVQSFKRVQEMTNGQLSIADNLNAAVIQVDCVHDTEALIPANILRGRPAFFQPLYTTVSRTDPTPARAVAMTPEPLNLSRTDGYVGLTVQFDLQHTYPRLEMYKTSNQSIAHATATTVTWDATGASRGSVITQSSGIFTVSEAGTYEFTAGIPFQTGVSYTGAEAYLVVNGAAAGSNITTYGDDYTSAALTDGRWINIKGSVQLAASSTVKVNAWQANAAAAARNVFGTAGAASAPATIAVQRLYNSTTSITACVTGILWGG